MAAEQNNSTKTLIITVLMTLLISGGLVAAFATQLKNYFFKMTTYYTCSILLQNGKNNPLSNVYIKVGRDSLQSGDSGTAMFRLKADKYECSFVYKNQKHREYYNITKDTNLVIDLSKGITDPVTGKNVTSNLAQPNVLPDQKVVKAPDAIRITAIESVSTTPKKAETKTQPQQAQQEAAPISANEILQSLQLTVKVDWTDSYKSNEQQYAYHYSLRGKAEYLNKIKEVLYQRNHETFSEYQKDIFNVSEDRASGFDYSGYQWGSITTTYVQIVLKTGEESDIILKSIKYLE